MTEAFIVWREDKVSATGSPEFKAMAQTRHPQKSVFIRSLKRTENIVPQIYSMAFNFVESEETRMMGLQDDQKVFKWFSRFDTNRPTHNTGV